MTYIAMRPIDACPSSYTSNILCPPCSLVPLAVTYCPPFYPKCCLSHSSVLQHAPTAPLPYVHPLFTCPHYLLNVASTQLHVTCRHPSGWAVHASKAESSRHNRTANSKPYLLSCNTISSNITEQQTVLNNEYMNPISLC